MKITKKEVECHSFIFRGIQFYAWIVEENARGVDTYGWYIQAKNCGIISYCFGLPKDTTTKEEFLDTVKKQKRDYASDYIDYIVTDIRDILPPIKDL